MNTRIRLARGKNSTIVNDTAISTEGHPIYNTDKKYLYIGDGTTSVGNNEPITTNRIEGWVSSTDYNKPDYTLYGDNKNTYLNSNLPIKLKVGNNNIATFNSTGISVNKLISGTITNAQSCTKLDTYKTINDIRFDGTNDITLPAGRTWVIKGDEANSTGWYHFMTVSFDNTHDNTYILLSINSTYENYKSGILAINLRYDASSWGKCSLNWLTRNSWDENAVFCMYDKTAERTLHFYVNNKSVNQWFSTAFTILSSSTRNPVYYANSVSLSPLYFPKIIPIRGSSVPASVTLADANIISTDNSTVSNATYTTYLSNNIYTDTRESATGLRLEPSTHYKFTNTNLTAIEIVTLVDAPANASSEYILEFSTVNKVPTITLPSSIKFANGVTANSFILGHKYIITINKDMGLAFVTFTEL